MKYISNLLAPFTALSLLFMIGCGGDDDSSTPGDGDSESAIIGTWAQDSASVITTPEGSGVTFTDFSITFATSDTEGMLRYTTSNTNTLVFPSQGTIEVPADPNFEAGVQVLRDSEVPMTVSLVGEDQLRMVFTIDADSGIPTENSRVAEVVGEYNFLLDRQE